MVGRTTGERIKEIGSIVRKAQLAEGSEIDRHYQSAGEYWFKAAKMHLEDERHAQAINAFKQAVKNYKHNANIYPFADEWHRAVDASSALAYLYARIGRFDDALAELKKMHGCLQKFDKWPFRKRGSSEDKKVAEALSRVETQLQFAEALLRAESQRKLMEKKS